MSTIQHSVTLEPLSCCRCGMSLALNRKWVEIARSMGEKGPSFWCPYCGTSQGWKGKPKHEKELDALRMEVALKAAHAKRMEDQRNDAMREAEHFRRSRDGMKGVLTKVKNRVAKGVCPCCNRTFANLARHMQTQHGGEVQTKEGA